MRSDPNRGSFPELARRTQKQLVEMSRSGEPTLRLSIGTIVADVGNGRTSRIPWA
jgi:hypothetical protein